MLGGFAAQSADRARHVSRQKNSTGGGGDVLGGPFLLSTLSHLKALTDKHSKVRGIFANTCLEGVLKAMGRHDSLSQLTGFRFRNRSELIACIEARRC